jgi:hypothetical protein
MNRFFRAISVLEGSFEEDRIDPATQDRMNKQNIVIVSPPDPEVFVEISLKIGRSESARKDQKRLSHVDNKILISSIWKYKKVVTADRRLAKSLVKHKSSVRNLAIILRDLVETHEISLNLCLDIFRHLSRCYEDHLGTSEPDENDLKSYKFP